METTQRFRLAEGIAIEEIPCNHVNGQAIIYWDDIELVFPGVKRVKCGNVSVNPLRDLNENRIKPYRIKHHPDVVLEVVLFTVDGNRPGTNSRNIRHSIASSEDDTVESLRITQILADTPGNNHALLCTSTPPSQSNSLGIRTSHKERLSFEQVVIQPDVEQQMVSSLPFDVQAQARELANIHDALVKAIKDGGMEQLGEQLVACLQSLNQKLVENNELASRIMELVLENNKLAAENNELASNMIKMQQALGAKQDEMKDLQIQALDRLALLQQSVKALMTQTYELHEYPIPRLFIVLPLDGSSWDPLDLFSNKFRLYFLCECGEHTKSTSSKIPHHIHVAKHEGYDIARPNEFFRQYGSYVLTILRMLKFGISAAGVAVPALPQLVRMDPIDQATASLKVLTRTIESGMDQVIGYIEKTSDEGEPALRFSEQIASNEVLEGADLRQLESFLKNKDANRVLGNLYRTVTSKGHVKWVCIDHYRGNYLEKAAKAFRDTVEVLKGSYDENIGRVKVELVSRVQAEQFYLALEKARSIYELNIEFGYGWDTTQSDFKRLRDTLAKTNVGILELSLQDMDGPNSDILNRSQRYDPIFDIMRHPSIQSVAIYGVPSNFIKRSSLQSRLDNFPNLRHLSINPHRLIQDISGLKSLVAKAPNLSRLTFHYNGDHVLPIYNAITEYQTYPVAFSGRSLRILPPKNKPSQLTTHLKDEMDLLKVLGGRIETVELLSDILDDSTIAGFAEAIEDGSSLKELSLKGAGLDLSEPCIKDLASVVARSELRKLSINLGNEVARVHILEPIQWDHLRELDIQMSQQGMETRVLRAIVDGTTKLSGNKLEEFSFYCKAIKGRYVSHVPLSMPDDGLLAAFLSSTSLRDLRLGVPMTPEEMFSLLSLVDLSQMQNLRLWTKDFDSEKVDTVLNWLQQATELRYIGLLRASITNKQVERMKTKGIQLSWDW